MTLRQVEDALFEIATVLNVVATIALACWAIWRIL